jgi:hypothetical protein
VPFVAEHVVHADATARPALEQVAELARHLLVEDGLTVRADPCLVSARTTKLALSRAFSWAVQDSNLRPWENKCRFAGSFSSSQSLQVARTDSSFDSSKLLQSAMFGGAPVRASYAQRAAERLPRARRSLSLSTHRSCGAASALTHNGAPSSRAPKRRLSPSASGSRTPDAPAPA